MTYAEFQRTRERAKQRELVERQNDMTAPRPAIMASIVDQMIRELYDKVTVLEGAVLAPAQKTAPELTPFLKKA